MIGCLGLKTVKAKMREKRRRRIRERKRVKQIFGSNFEAGAAAMLGRREELKLLKMEVDWGGPAAEALALAGQWN